MVRDPPSFQVVVSFWGQVGKAILYVAEGLCGGKRGEGGSAHLVAFLVRYYIQMGSLEVCGEMGGGRQGTPSGPRLVVGAISILPSPGAPCAMRLCGPVEGWLLRRDLGGGCAQEWRF